MGAEGCRGEGVVYEMVNSGSLWNRKVFCLGLSCEVILIYLNLATIEKISIIILK